MNINEADIQKIVQSVLQNIERDQLNKITPIPLKIVEHQHSEQRSDDKALFQTSVHPLEGVFDQMTDAITAADKAGKQYVKEFQLADRERILKAVRKAILASKETLAKLVYEETNLGRFEDKVAKHELAAIKTPGTEDLQPTVFSGDAGLTLVENAPFGVVGAITPVTNPTETIINNTISLLAAGNTVVFNVHPTSKKSSAYVVDLMNQTIIDAGGIANLITMVSEPTMSTIETLISSPKVKLLLGTGGPGLVKKLLSSGKKAIGAGAGNPPVIVDETADLEHAAKHIILGASFDNNILCIAEKSVFVLETVADDLIYHMLSAGAYMLNSKQLKAVMDFALVEASHQDVAKPCTLTRKRKFHAAKEWIGKDATLFLEKLNVKHDDQIKLLICETDADHPFVQTEQMMPVLPIVRVKSLEEAIDLAVKTEGGNRHTAVMHSRHVDHLTQFAKAIETTIFVKNASSLAGVGYGGEGPASMTIAGPTGEGITTAKTFTRQRRCVLAEGGFRII